jgi:hypothetical protein
VIFLKEIIKSGGKRKTFYLSNTGLFVCGCFTQDRQPGFPRNARYRAEKNPEVSGKACGNFGSSQGINQKRR